MNSDEKKIPTIFRIYIFFSGDQDFSEKIYFKLQDDGMDIVFCGNNESSESFEEALKKMYNCWSTTEHCDNPDL